MDGKFATRIESNQDYQAIVVDLAKLRSDMTQLAHHLAKGSASAAIAAQAQLTAEANRLRVAANGAGKSAAKSVEAQLDSHPARSVMLAFALGFVSSRLLSHQAAGDDPFHCRYRVQPTRFNRTILAPTNGDLGRPDPGGRAAGMAASGRQA